MYSYNVSLDAVTNDAAFISFQIVTAGRTVDSGSLDLTTLGGPPYTFSFPWGTSSIDHPDVLWEDPLGTNVISASVFDANNNLLYTKTHNHLLVSSGAATANILHLDADHPTSYYLPYDDVNLIASILNINADVIYPQGLFGDVLVDAICDIPPIYFNSMHFYTAGTYTFLNFNGAVDNLIPWTPTTGNYLMTLRVNNPNGGVINTYTFPIVLFQGLFAFVYLVNFPNGITFSATDPNPPFPVWRALASADASNVHCNITVQSGPSDITFFNITSSFDITVNGRNVYISPATFGVLPGIVPGNYLLRLTLTSGAYSSYADFPVYITV